MDIELEQVVSEARRLHDQFVTDHVALVQRWSELVEEHKSQVDTWSLTRPHSDELEESFLEQRKSNMSINSEFRDWTRRYNVIQTELQSELTLPSEADVRTKLAAMRKLRSETLRNLEVEIPLLQGILSRFESAVRSLGSYNSAPE